MSSEISIKTILSEKDIIEDFSKKQQHICDKLNTGQLLTIEEIISIDPTCRWKMGADHCLDINTYSERNYNSFTVRNYQCKSCKIFNEIADYNHLVLPQAFSIDGQKYQIESYNHVNLVLNQDNNQILSDRFTHQLLLGSLLKDNQHISKIIHGFICNYNGTLFREKCKIGFIDSLITYEKILENGKRIDGKVIKPSIIIDILNQIIDFFQLMKDYNLVLGNINNNTLCFSRSNNKVIVKINDLKDISLNIEGLRIIPKTFWDNRKIKYILYETDLGDSLRINIEPGNFNQHREYINYRHSGSSEFNSVINIYMVMLKLASNRLIFKSILDDPEIQQWWFSLWLPNVYPKINARLIEIQENEEEINVYPILTKYQLKKKIQKIPQK